MATTPAPVPEVQPSLSPMARIGGIFFSPGKVFADIVKKPNWIQPLALSLLVVLAVCICLNQRVNWREYIGQQLDKNPRAAQLSAEQKSQQIEMGAKYAPISTYAFGLVGHVLGVLLVALVMWGAYSLMGGISTNFSTAFSISVHSFLTGLVSGPLFILVLYLKPYGTADLDNPLASNLAAILPDESAKWLVALCKSFDIFIIWMLVLLAIGFAAVNPRKMKGAKPYTIAVSLWAFFVALRVGWAFIFS
jgi:hypothetical protein